MSEPGIRTRGPELVVAALLMGVAALIVVDSLRVGTGWSDDGPRAGYFPFYIGLILFAASGTVLVGQLLRWRRDDEEFAERSQIALVLAVLWPMALYVALIFPLGIYISSALLIGYFMLRYGRYALKLTVPVAVGVPLVFYAVFERWFLVPLPKGMLGSLLGF